MSKNDNKKQVVINVESQTVLRVLVLVVVTLIALTFVKTIAPILILIMVSFFLAMALNPAVSWIAGKLKSRSRVRATGAAYLMVVLFLTGFFSLVVPPLINQTSVFIRQVPSTISSLQREDSSLSKFIQRYELQDQVNEFSAEFRDKFKDIGAPALAKTAGTIGTTVVNAIIVFVLTFMMLVEGPMWLQRSFKLISSKRRRDHIKGLALKMYKVVVGYVNGQVIVAFISGTFAAISLYILSQIFDAPINAIALGGIVGLFALLPMVGTIIGASIAVLASLLVSLPLAIAATIFFIVYQQIENVTIQPYIQARTNHLTPLTVLVAALIGVGLGGILGALLAIPTAGIIKVLFDDYLERNDKRNDKNLTTAKSGTK
ncbi:AI-2E family transporter [Candidatus Parcubacteria bacterium]|nr:AI-2E family transporter [Candidatus Parcubacteria bacterium]